MNEPIAPMPLWVRLLLAVGLLAVFAFAGTWAVIVAQGFVVVVALFWAAWRLWRKQKGG